MGIGGEVAVVGYSFGTLMAVHCARVLGLTRVVGISPPLGEIELESEITREMDVRLLAAAEDVFCPPEQAKVQFEGLPVAVQPVVCDDHFFRGMERELASMALEALSDG